MGRFRSLGLLIALGGLAGPWAARATAQADVPARAEPFRLRVLAAAGSIVSADQHALLALDLPVVEGGVRGGYRVHDAVVIEAQLAGGAYLSSTAPPGGLVDLSVGLEVGASVGTVRPWASAHGGFGLTGALVRPVLRVGAGLDVRVTDELSLGPVIAYGHVFQDDGEGFTDDAQWLSLGLGLTFSPVARPAPSPPAARRPEPPPPRPATLVAPPPIAAAPPEQLMAMLDEAAGLSPRELLVPVLFHFDSTELVACSVASLHSLRAHLEQRAEITVLEIEGHADGSGSIEHNAELSRRRAEAIRDWLVERGIATERLRVSARGESAPVETNEVDEGREQNRRVRFRVLEEAR